MSRLIAERLVPSAFPALLVATLLPFAAFGQTRTDTTSTSGTRLGRAVPVTPAFLAPARTVGAEIVTIDSSNLTVAHPRSLSELLRGRVAGLSVARAGGNADEGARVRLRGSTSIFGDPEPLIVVDGVRVPAPQMLRGISRVGSSRLNDFAPEEIERIDVLPGAAAGAMYGASTARGVLVITTRRGRPGRPRWSGWAESGRSNDVTAYPANYHRNGTDPATGARVSGCDIAIVAMGQCTPTTTDVWNPLEQASPFRQGHADAGGLSVTGGPFGIAGYTSASERRELGVLGGDARRFNARVNAERELFGRLTIRGSLGHVRRRAGFLEENAVQRGIWGTATDGPSRGYWGGTDLLPTTRSGDRLTRAVQAEWRALSWLRISGVTGRDETTQDDVQRWAGDQNSNPFTESYAHRLSSTMAHVGGVASYDVRGAAMQTVLAYEESRDALEQRDSVQSAVIAVAFFVQSRALRSWSLQQRMELARGLFANVGSRWLAHARRGGGGRLFPAIDVSWSPEAIVPGGELRVRAAYAEGAGEDAVAAARLARVPYLYVYSPVGRERSREAELGLDLLLGGRLSIDATGFIQRTPNLLAVEATLNGGFPLTYHPGVGRLENRGLEMRASGELFESDAVRWRSTLTLALLRNRVIRIGDLPLRKGYVETAAGEPFGGLVAQPFTWNRPQDQDTLPKAGEFLVGTDRVVGTVLPTRQAALRSEFSLRRLGVTLAVALEHLGGHRLVNSVAEAQCRRRGTCAALQAQASLADRVRAVAASHSSAENTFHESGAYTRFDELAIRWRLPVRWTESLGSAATLSLESRNLATWTSFRGLDPEVATARALTDAPTDIGQPLPRTFSLRLDVSPRSR